jgi:hypothetical protein
MIEYNEFMLGTFFMIAASIAAIMEKPIKPTIKQLFTLIESKTSHVISDDMRYTVYQAVAIALGIAAAAMEVDDVSFSRLFYATISDDLKWLEIIVTGIMLGLGDIAINGVVKFAQRDGMRYILAIFRVKIEPPSE